MATKKRALSWLSPVAFPMKLVAAEGSCREVEALLELLAVAWCASVLARWWDLTMFAAGGCWFCLRLADGYDGGGRV